MQFLGLSDFAEGHLLGHVKDLGRSSDDPHTRIYQTRERQTHHTDSSDVVGLLCLRAAKSGGLSSLVSSTTIFNELVHNHTILHDRTAFEDHPETEQKRYLLRLWVAPPNARPLPEVYAERFGSIKPGDRGGVVVPGATPSIPLE